MLLKVRCKLTGKVDIINGMYVNCRVLYAKWHNLYVKITCEMMAFNRKNLADDRKRPNLARQTDWFKRF